MTIVILYIDVTESSEDKSNRQPPHKKLKTDEQISISSSTLSTRKHPVTPLPVEESDLQPCLQKRPKKDKQTQLSSTTTNISTLPQHPSGNTIPDAIPGCTMNPEQLTENVNECSSSMRSTNGQPTLPLSSTDIYRTHISDPHEIRLYRNYQKARYQRTEFPTYFKEPNPSIKTFINLKLVHKKRENKEERIEGITDKLHGNVTEYVQKRGPLGIEQIAEVKESEKLPRNILIEGDPGVGKTTLVWELCKGWGDNRLLHQWDVVVLIQLRDNRMRKAKCIEDIIYHPRSDVHKTVSDHIVETNGKRWMFIFDGYDELSVDQQIETSVFQQLLTGDLLPSASIVVTSRPLATRTLPDQFKTHLHEHIEVVGFSDNDIDAYIKCKFCDNPDMLKDFQSYISSRPFIYKAMYIPLHCALVTDLYQTYWRKGKKEFAPKTFTQLYTCFIHSLLERYLDDHPVYGPHELSIQELTDLPGDVYDDLIKLAELAAKGIEEQQYVFDNLTHNTLGLMQRVSDSESHKSKSVSYSFLHLTLQEYFASLYWSKLPSEDVSHIFTESGALPVEEYYIDDDFWAEHEYTDEDSIVHLPVLHFYAGLTGIVGTPLDSILVGIKSNDSLHHNVLHLLFESQNPEYISTVLKENQYVVDIQSKLQGYVTGYCISHCSSSAEWKIDVAYCNLLQPMVSRMSRSMGGTISSLRITDVTDYSRCLQMIFQLHDYTKELSWLNLFSMSNSFGDNDCIRCDELSQLYRYCPKLKSFTLTSYFRKLNCTPFFSSLHQMTCLETLHLESVVLDDSSHIVSNGLRQTTTLKSLILCEGDLLNLLPEGLSQNLSIVSLTLRNVKMNIEGFKAIKQILKDNRNLESLDLRGAFHCPPNEEHSISHIVTKNIFEGIQQNMSLKQLSLFKFQLFGLEEISKNSTLNSLMLSKCNIDEEVAVALRQVLIENTSLRELTLDDCIKSMDVAVVVAEGLQYNTGVVKLRLGNKGHDVIRKLMQGLSLRKNSTLTSLRLWNVNIDKEGARALKLVLVENTTLRKMTIYNCIISVDVAEVVAEGLQYNTGIVKLTLGYHTKDGIIRTLTEKLLHSSSLQSLILCDNDINIEDYHVFSDLLKSNQTLKYLTIIEDDLERAKFLAGSFSNCNSEKIQVLDKRRILGQDGAKVLVDALMNNTVTKLILPDMYQQDLSVYSYPVDRVIYQSKKECKLLYN